MRQGCRQGRGGSESVNLESIFHTYDYKGEERIWKWKKTRGHQGLN